MITRDFVLAGNATFTIESPDDKHRTYRVERVEGNERFPKPAYFVKTLAEPNNESDYVYMGKLDPFTFQVQTTSKSHNWKNTMRLRLLNRVLARVESNDHGAYEKHGFKVYHSGHCGRCGRLLTTPLSIETGIGPTCRKLLGIVTPNDMEDTVLEQGDGFGQGVLDTAVTIKQTDVNYFRAPATVA